MEQVSHALKVQQHVTTYFEELYQLPYELPKVDLIAIPDFVTGAMEQWGLITYRETSLLYDSAADATSPRQSKSSTISHEYVHQWFGNLVTCKWWDNIWIQEGPATFWSQEGIEEAYKNDPWDMEKQQIYNSITYSLNRDVSVTGRPIVSAATNPDEITAAFDWVIYDKAASIIYTLREAMGKQSFDKATTQFLTKFQFQAADELDFIEAYQNQATADNIKIGETPLDVKALMHPFLKQALYPLLTAKIEGNDIVITQGDRPFLHNADSTLPEAEYNFKYSLVVSSNQNDRAWFSSTASEIRFPKPTGSEIFKLNSGQKGYYRVKYEGKGTLNDELVGNIEKLDEMDRMGVVDDAFNLAISGDITYSAALDTVEYIANGGENSYYVWGVFGSRTSYMRTQLAGTAAGDKFIAYFKNAVSQQFDRFGLEVDSNNDSHIDKKMRSNIVSLSVSFGVEKATEQASAIYKAWKDSDGQLSKRPHPDVAGTVYNLGVSSGTFEDWEFMYAQYAKELVADEKKKYMRAMAATENVTTIDFMLNTLAMDKTIILEQDFFTFINYISYTTVGERMTWDWVRVHWAQLVERFGTNDRNFGRLAPNIANDFKTEYGLWSAADFFQVTEADAGAGEGPRKSTIAQIESNIDWLENYESDILAWLESH
ncbi:unnamed protein product [Oikopleura dioica]|uniref:glutamyl aminopeptidase n=1 Tax=Oikopleura dioica TaxID=34765 RepID=E4YLS1_OIKDI|nr:unnamed protein product [Oikopleura dioica]